MYQAFEQSGGAKSKRALYGADSGGDSTNGLGCGAQWFGRND